MQHQSSEVKSLYMITLFISLDTGFSSTNSFPSSNCSENSLKKILNVTVQISPSLLMFTPGLTETIIFLRMNGTPVAARKLSKFSFLSKLKDPISFSAMLWGLGPGQNWKPETAQSKPVSPEPWVVKTILKTLNTPNVNSIITQLLKAFRHCPVDLGQVLN